MLHIDIYIMSPKSKSKQSSKAMDLDTPATDPLPRFPPNRHPEGPLELPPVRVVSVKKKRQTKQQEDDDDMELDDPVDDDATFIYL